MHLLESETVWFEWGHGFEGWVATVRTLGPVFNQLELRGRQTSGFTADKEGIAALLLINEGSDAVKERETVDQCEL